MEGDDTSLPTRVAALVHAHFNALPVHHKPRTRDDGSTEWIPMSGIVAVRGQGTPSETLTCIAVTTGARCLASSQITHCHGLVLHDCHAEVLAIRAFNYWVMNECLSVIQHEKSPPAPSQTEELPAFIRRRKIGLSSASGPPFEICPDIKLYMYCTCAPCGDASMELCMAEQDDPTPWVVLPRNEEILLDGRAHFSILGVVRRKPARADAEATRSKSCSDKLALRQVTSLLSYPASMLVAPTSSAYISALILPEEEISRSACDRAFGPGPTGRMKNLVGTNWPAGEKGDDSLGYRFRPFQVLAIPMERVKPMWPFGKYRTDQVKLVPSPKSKPGNASAVWIAATSFQKPYQASSTLEANYLPRLSPASTSISECIIGGVKEGRKISSITPQGASVLSRAKMWAFVYDILVQSGIEKAVWQDILESPTYEPDNITTNEKTSEEKPSHEHHGIAKEAISHLARHRTRHQIDVHALGKPGNIIVLSRGKKKLRKLGKKTKPTKKEEKEEENDKKEDSLDDSTPNVKIDGIDDKNFITLLEELRLSYPPGEDLSKADWIKLQTKIELSFTKEQMITYMRHIKQSTLVNQEDSVPGSERWITVEDQLQPTDGASGTELHKSPHIRNGGEGQRVFALKKDKIAELILRDYWKLGLQGTKGNLDIELPSHVISLLVESDKYSLEELAYSHGIEIEPYISQNIIRVSGYRGPCESVREIVRTYASDIQTRPIDVSFVNRLQTEKGDPPREEIFRWIKETYGASLEYHSRQSILLASCFSGSEDILQGSTRDLELISYSMAEKSDDVAFSTYAPASEAGYLNRASPKRTDLMSFIERPKSWARWSIPVAPERFSKNALPSLFSQHYTGRSSQILRFLRKDNTQSVGLDFEEKLTATIGQSLFNTEKGTEGRSYTAPQLGELGVPRFFHKRVSKAKDFLPNLSPFPGKGQEALFRFQMVPCQPHKASLPIIEVELELPLSSLGDHGPERLLSDITVSKVKAITKQKSIDYLFPETNHDIRFTQTVTRDLLSSPDKESVKPVQKAILSILEAMGGKIDRVFPPSCQLPLPASILRDLPSKERQRLDTPVEDGQDFILGNYWLPSTKLFRESNTRFYDFMGEKLSHSFSTHGPWDSLKEEDLNLEMVLPSNPPSHHPRNPGGKNGEIEDKLEKEFDSFYRTACILAFSLSTHSKEQNPQHR
ncbi:tRNA-specific adenosine deaminase 1 [Talaromyces islandicus]|uniref:tRNA-specific adenosine deaminase 1 n=1 Tax=Talaromyces islandicus TaxID=28573 RepID=A0A0U1LQW7_TALIS|nr:tRNA-specific adenosine deaminase 1 [Talaromyces islandicus]